MSSNCFSVNISLLYVSVNISPSSFSSHKHESLHSNRLLMRSSLMNTISVMLVSRAHTHNIYLSETKKIRIQIPRMHFPPKLFSVMFDQSFTIELNRPHCGCRIEFTSDITYRTASRPMMNMRGMCGVVLIHIGGCRSCVRNFISRCPSRQCIISTPPYTQTTNIYKYICATYYILIHSTALHICVHGNFLCTLFTFLSFCSLYVFTMSLYMCVCVCVRSFVRSFYCSFEEHSCHALRVPHTHTHNHKP